MSPGTPRTLQRSAIVAAIALAAATGYWMGTRQPAAAPEAAATAPQGKERQLLYYRNPMGLPDTSPVPKKDPMGMDYIPVYAGEEAADSGSGLTISPEKVQKLGVRTETARLEALDKVIRAAGRVEPDERRTYAIAPKFEGYVERLLVNTTGQPVGKGQPLFEVYSPELVSAQREYAIAAQGVAALPEGGGDTRRGMQELAEASLSRLRNWDISDEQVKHLAQSGQARRTLTFRAPVAGIVTEKKAVQGMRFMPGEALYQITDLSAVWVMADVFEQDIGSVKPGAKARVRINAYPDKVFEGSIGYVYPTLKAETRTVPVRLELPNPGNLLKPGMFAQVELPTAGRAPAVTVPTSAVIDSGTRQVVLVQSGAGRFEPREVKLGARSDDRVEVVSGIREGEAVVVAANFLIDAESNLKAALGSFAPPAPDKAQGTAGVGHRAEGKVEDIDAATGTLTISHGPVASLKWPAMTMEFKAAHGGLLQNLKPGTAIAFEFVERNPGEWVITALKPNPPAATAHAGH